MPNKKKKEDLFNILSKNRVLETICEDISEKGLCINLNAVNCKFCPVSGIKILKETLEIDG